MKLYSRRQLAFFSILSAFIVVFLAFGIGLLKLPLAGSKNSKEVNSSGEKSASLSKTDVRTTPEKETN
ncbi:MAG: peptidase S1, partial [Treponema sp.]|nr:peptidase S1 [Treponema sp.]